MVFSTTGFAYLFGAFGMALLVDRFYVYWRRQRTTVSKLFILFLATFCLFFLVVAFAGIFLTENIEALKVIVFISAFLQIISGAVVGYLFFYLRFPKISPWIGPVLICALGLLVLGMTLTIPFSPRLQENGAINWDIPLLVGILRFVMFIPLLPVGIVCVLEGIKAKGETKSRFLAIGVLFFGGFLASPFDFFLSRVVGYGAHGSDIAIACVGALFLAVVLAIQRNPKPTYVKKI